MRTYHITSLRTICVVLCSAWVLIVCSGTFFSNLFYQEAQKLLLLQNEYRAYVDIMKRVLEKDHEGDNVEPRCIFPQGVSVVSSDSKISPDMTSISVNRDNEYLKQSAVSFYKAHNLDTDIVIKAYESFESKKQPIKKLSAGYKKKKKINQLEHSYNHISLQQLGNLKKKVHSYGLLHSLNFG